MSEHLDIDAAVRFIAARYRARVVRWIDRGEDDGEDVELCVTTDLEKLANLGGRVFVPGARANLEVAPAGFVLEEMRQEGAVFLRATAPTFRLFGGRVTETAKGPALQIDRPRMVLQLSKRAAAVLRALPGKAEELAERADVSLGSVAAIVQTFAARGLVLRDAPRALSRPPRVSIVIPAFGRPDATRATVLSALELSYPKERLDIVVVDDASPVPIDFAGEPEIDDRVRVIRRHRNGGPAAARNTGLHEAKGDLVAFLDNDCTVSSTWLVILAAALEEAEVDIAGGRALAPFASAESSVLTRYEAARSPLDMGKTYSAVGLGELVPYLPSTNLLVRRNTALRLGGFREGMHLGEDVDFIWRARGDAGSRVVYEPAATIVHHHRERLGEMLRRRAEYASSEPKLARLHPESRRTFVLPTTTLMFLGALVFHRAALGFATSVIPLLVSETFAKRRKLGAMGLPTTGVLTSVLRAHGAALYHLSAAVSRYFGLAVMAIAIAYPRAALPALALLFTYPIVDAKVRRARVPLVCYVFLYTLEMIAYQLGILSGMATHRSFFLPRIQFRR